nr:hypothetical protein [Mycoplasmopsis bovis]
MPFIEAQKEFGSVDLMLNNAGIMPLDKYYEQFIAKINMTL